ncbi:MAG: serine protease, partial [Planctomycetaceae bacterium]|nr:serine protease [Planctomycetaceae bacterium]
MGSQHLIQCVPPTNQYKWPAAECRIENRKTTSKLDESQQQQLDRIGYRDADLRWMLHRGQSPLNGGGALVNENGDLVGMTVKSFPQTSSNDLCLAIPASYIHDLKQNATDTTTPLPVPELGQAGSARIADKGQAESETNMEAAPVRPDNDGLTVLPNESLRRKLSLDLNRAGQKCGEFAWWPTSDEQAADIQQFVDHLVTADRVILAEPDDEKETPTLQKQVDYWW